MPKRYGYPCHCAESDVVERPAGLCGPPGRSDPRRGLDPEHLAMQVPGQVPHSARGV